MKHTRRSIIGGIVYSVLFFTTFLTAKTAFADGTMIYFIRHAEKQIALTDSGGYFVEDCIEYEPGKTCCIQELSDLGLLHRDKLADRFEKKGITAKLTHIFSSHKQRTTQTVQRIADDAGLEVRRMGPSECMEPGAECDPGCESGKDSISQTLEALHALPQGSTALVAQHSGSIYLILEELGIDTSDPATFPRDENGKVAGFNNLWKIRLSPSGKATLKKNVILDLTLKRTNKGARSDKK